MHHENRFSKGVVHESHLQTFYPRTRILKTRGHRQGSMCVPAKPTFHDERYMASWLFKILLHPGCEVPTLFASAPARARLHVDNACMIFKHNVAAHVVGHTRIVAAALMTAAGLTAPHRRSAALEAGEASATPASSRSPSWRFCAALLASSSVALRPRCSPHLPSKPGQVP